MILPAAIQRLGEDWRTLYAAAQTDGDRQLIAAIAARVEDPATPIASIADLATDDQVAALARFLERQAAPVDGAYERHKQRTAQRQREKSQQGRDIGPLPPIADPARRQAGRDDLQQFLTTYFPRAFPLPFCDKQRVLIQRLQVSCLLGALFATAIDRGCGKTTICIRTAIWSALYRHHLFTILLGATDEKAVKSMLGIKTELRSNPLLAADFPEVCYPVYCLQGINQRAKGQLLDGEPTAIEWTDSRLILPTVAGVPGCILEAGGLLTAVRGAQHTAADGTIWRPSFVLIDDPQTRESAASIDQTNTRLDIINGDVLGMAGPGQPIAVAIPCTIIVNGDAADVLTDRQKSPDWRGQRCGIVDQLPDDLTQPGGGLWLDYFEILDRIKDIPDEADDTLAQLRAEATAFYQANRAAMDAGCTPTWPERHLPWEASAVQHALNRYHRSETAFWSEYMNQPLDPYAAAEQFLTADEIASRFSGYTRGTLPLDTQILTAGVDVQHRCLYWLVLATDLRFTSQVVDYGCFPEQGRPTWKATKAERTLKLCYPGTSTEGAIYAGLRELHNTLLTTKYERVDNQPLPLQLLLTDANDKTAVVKKAIRESDHAARMLPCHGKYYGPNQTQISGWKRKTGERQGDEWLVRPGQGRAGRHVIFDTDHWKMFAQRRLATPPGDRGSLTIYGRQKQRPHAFLADHLTAEGIERVSGNRTVDHWSMKPGRSENHWLDALVMALVAASMCGAQITGQPAAAAPPKRRGRRTTTYLNL